MKRVSQKSTAAVEKVTQSSTLPTTSDVFTEAPLCDLNTSWARLWAKLLTDPRDVVFVNYQIFLTLTVIPVACCFYLAQSYSWWFAVVYWCVYALWVPRFILMSHCHLHRPFFKSQYSLLSSYHTWVIGPFAGITPESYRAHHIGMHHKEGNLSGDLSSTMPYQRDNFIHWLHYAGTFATVGVIKLILYLYRTGRSKILYRLLLGEASYWTMTFALGYFVSWQATFTVFWIPLQFTRVAMMIGNWGQHAFVDPKDPTNDFTSSTTTIGTQYNIDCFNDGYHIVHHAKPAMHYSEMADEFDKNRSLYGAQDAIVINGVDQFGIWLHLMSGQHKQLARRVVRLPGAPSRTDEEMVDLMRSRLTPFKP